MTSESGTSASLSVVLTSQPAANVTISLASSDTTEGTVSPATLVFTSANWNTAQLASVTGVNDAQVDGNISYVVSASTASADPNYGGLVASASAVNQDNDFVVTYTSSNVPKSIPDANKVTSTLTALAHTIRDVNVQLNITHGRADDVEVYLSDPGGRKVELLTDVGSSGNNFTNTILDDEASTAITAGRSPFTGSYRPEGSLAAFDNRNSLGTWTLEVGDDKKGQRGTLNQWSITIVYEQASAGSSGQARRSKGQFYARSIGGACVARGAG